ncbi:Fic family protein [Dysgonomonas alginatilytica]|uniref:Fic family protein n=1 Tax=Dysgonomonas alginatilytica TaxID=1605892 RepID=A0A2V3PNX9_9BACT|nr:Fic family protein [Dysgonomonas alginatilytica]PXV62869.1 Fic family protein [Dysgonomonas alginatilytica]
MGYIIPKLPLNVDVETKAILKQLNAANKKLAELKGVALTIPNENILINTLSLQEAKDSSAIENIVTTNDELFKGELDIEQKAYMVSEATKEVLNYALALRSGFSLVRKSLLLTNSHIKQIQEILEENKAGFRTVPGTTLKNQLKEVVYTPPQDRMQIEGYMTNLEIYINDDSVSEVDPLIKMSIIHHQFESIHPFYDGNGRTGRIINILYLVTKGLLDLPILYLSRYFIRTKAEYYTLLQKVRDTNQWEEWVLYVLKGVEQTATQTIQLVKGISLLMTQYKQEMRPLLGKAYNHELLNNLFNHPYTKIEFVVRDLNVTRITATGYLEKLVKAKLLTKIKLGKYNYYLNMPLIDLLMSTSGETQSPHVEQIESINN